MNIRATFYFYHDKLYVFESLSVTEDTIVILVGIIKHNISL